MKLIAKGSENYVFDPSDEALAILRKLPPPSRSTVGTARAWAEEKPGFWRCSRLALEQLRGLAS